MSEVSEHIGYVLGAELQFRLASAVRLATTMGEQPLDLPIEWSHGKHKVQYREVALRKDQAEVAAAALHHSATYLMAVAMKDAVRAAHHDPKSHNNPDIVGAYQIARLIRNAFAHNPFNPVWSVDPDCRDKKFAVANLISLDTADLQGKAFDWRHYGGPLALLRLSQFVRFEVLGDKSTKPSNRVVAEPPREYYQQGDMILRKLDE